MKLSEATGWSQEELDLTMLDENGVDEDVLIDMVKDRDLILTFFGKDLDSMLEPAFEVFAQRISKEVWDLDRGHVSPDSKFTMTDFYYDPKKKELLGLIDCRADISFPGSRGMVGFTRWFRITKTKTMLIKEKIGPGKPKNGPTEAELKLMINLKWFAYNELSPFAPDWRPISSIGKHNVN